jgi:hypothetical protein
VVWLKKNDFYFYNFIIVTNMKNNKIPCSNISTETYTGKEQSPKRFGLSAEGFEINYEKEGYDKQIWSVQLKNNRKVWVRNSNRVNITHEEPIINNHNIPQLVEENTSDVVEEKEKETNETTETTIVHNDNSVTTAKTEKKKTDYNIFIKYYLDKLKAENKDKTTNKVLFSVATEEWARLKKNPDELKKIMATIKK